MEYKYTQNPTAKIPIIVIDQLIGTNEAGVTGIDEGQFTREILALKNAGVTNAEVWINSKGGLWSSGVGMVSAMNSSGIDFTTVNMGFADSTAGHIFQAGKVRRWKPYALSLIHEIQGNGSADILEAMNNSIATMLCGKTNKTAAEVRALMAANTPMDADMAKDFGFCDIVDKMDGQSILRFTNSSEAFAEGEKQIKKALPKNKNMKEVNEILGLTNEASETAQLTAIKTIINARNAAETALATEKTEHATTKEALTLTTGKLTVAENSILTATNESKRIKAEALVKEHVGTRIVDTPENITRFTNLAVADYDGTKAIIEAINLNAKAPEPIPAVKRSENAPITSVSEYRNAPAVRN